MVNHCLVLNMDHRTDLWDKLKTFRDEWTSHGKSLNRISGTNYTNKNESASFFSSSGTYFIQSGKNIIFNKKTNKCNIP